MNKLIECVQYFKQRKCFERMLQGLKYKYESLGHLGWCFVLEHVNDEERKGLCGFLCKDFSKSTSIKLSVAQIEKALADSKFDGVALVDVVREYFGGCLYSIWSSRQ